MDQLASLLGAPVDRLERLVAESANLYRPFSVRKANGKIRVIRAPDMKLRVVQRELLNVLQSRVRYPSWMTGGVPGRSIFHHARPHVGKGMVATFDIEAFFPSTNCAMVAKSLAGFGVDDAAAEAVLRLITIDDQLPQGSPTSGFIANMCLDASDRQIHALCRKHSLSFTRFVDDMALSGDEDLTKFYGVVADAVRACGYKLAAEKTKYMPRSHRQVVTKLVVNDKLRPTPEFLKDLKAQVRSCLDNGAWVVANASGLSVRTLKWTLAGKVSHVCGADPELGKELRGRLRGVVWADRDPANLELCSNSESDDLARTTDRAAKQSPRPANH
jgi:RNA-directed DNA polymerase